MEMNTKCAICGRTGRYGTEILYDYEHKQYECLNCIKTEMEKTRQRI